MHLFTLTDIINNSANLFPQREAFKCGDKSITYAELNYRTDQLAKCLKDIGVKKGDRVGIYLNRCLETPIAIYGILKAGAAYVPIDFTAPNIRNQSVIKNCDIHVLISSPTASNKIKKLIDFKSNLKYLIGVSLESSMNSISWDTVNHLDLKNYSPVEIFEQDLAYIMFTSGSTGEPKGIMHTHKSGLTYAKLSSELYELNHNDRAGNHAPIHFDISTFGYFSVPLVGGLTVIVSDAHTKLPSSLAQLIANEKLTIWYSVPLALMQVLDSGLIDKLDMSTLRWVLFGGEVFGLKHLKRLLEKWPNAEFSNIYGPAEINQCTYYNFKTLAKNIETLPLGKVWKHTEFKVVDTNFKPVRQGDKGELILSSPTMMKGYWNNTERTKKSFFYEKLNNNLERVYYKTGDLVYEDENGVLFFAGRNDRQIKLRGYRIELDEIESVLTNHACVNEVAVILMDEENEKKIYAAVLPYSHISISIEELVSHCKKHLPTYAVPDLIEIIEDLPRTSSGKIDKKKIIKVKEN